jgi:hypothetical protein
MHGEGEKDVHESYGLLRLMISNLETPTGGTGGITRSPVTGDRCV